jgi:hypothetical protein
MVPDWRAAFIRLSGQYDRLESPVEKVRDATAARSNSYEMPVVSMFGSQ